MSLIALKATKTKRGLHSLTKTYGQIALSGELPIQVPNRTKITQLSTFRKTTDSPGFLNLSAAQPLDYCMYLEGSAEWRKPLDPAASTGLCAVTVRKKTKEKESLRGVKIEGLRTMQKPMVILPSRTKSALKPCG